MTAVEWLIDELTDNGIEYLDLAYEIIEQAKEMEKQQIMEAWHNGKINEQDFFSDHTGTIVRANFAEQYYNETYKPSA
jgi:hypothetical protein